MMAAQRSRAAVQLPGSVNPRVVLRTAVALLLPGLLVIGAYAVAPEQAPAPSARTFQRVRDLVDLRNALEAYRADRGRYPESPGPGGWAGLHNAWGVSTPEWIPDLAPRYIASLPREPREDSNGSNQYIYKSDGTNFKLLVFYPERDCAVMAKLRPELLDPIRGGGPYPCHAYGFWSSGAAGWQGSPPRHRSDARLFHQSKILVLRCIALL